MRITDNMLKRGKKFEESVEEKALKWKRYFEEKRHIYALILGPFFDVQRLLGRAPFYRDENGNMRFEIFSGIAMYSILLYILLSTTAILSIVDINNEVRVSFIGVLNRTLAISLIVPQLVMPILSWIHLKRMQKYFDLWFAFQEKFEKVTETSFPALSDFKPPAWKIVTHYIGTGVVIIVALPYYLRKNLKWYQLPAFYADILSNLLHFWYWIITAQIITVVAKKFHSCLHEEILKGNGYTLKIEEYRLLWIDLNYLIRESGSCSGLIVSFFILSNMFTLIIFTYNSIFRLPKFLRESKYGSVLSALAATAFFWNYMVTYCDAGYKMTTCSFKGIFDRLVLLQRDGSYKEELYISMFLSTVRIYPAKAIISEFYIINRSFFGSISTYLVTLIIVLEQFNVGRNTIQTESVQPTTYFPISTSS